MTTPVPSRTAAERFAAGAETFARFSPGEPSAELAAGMERARGAIGTLLWRVVGETWGNPDLSRRDRSLITVAAQSAQARADELTTHTRFALRHGMTQTEIEEIVLTVVAYSGFPAALAAGRAVDAGLRAELGDDALAAREAADHLSDDERDARAHEVFARMKGAATGADPAADIARMTDRYGRVGLTVYRFTFGEVWARPQLSRRDRSLAVIAILVANGTVEELHSHVPTGLRHGLTADEIDAAIDHLSLYVGMPRALDAARVVQAELRKAAED